jgi:hypothetical protein
MSNIKQYPMPITKKLEITKYPDPCWVKSNLERIERLAVQANCTQDNAQQYLWIKDSVPQRFWETLSVTDQNVLNLVEQCLLRTGSFFLEHYDGEAYVQTSRGSWKFTKGLGNCPHLSPLDLIQLVEFLESLSLRARTLNCTVEAAFQAMVRRKKQGGKRDYSTTKKSTPKSNWIGIVFVHLWAALQRQFLPSCRQ